MIWQKLRVRLVPNVVGLSCYKGDGWSPGMKMCVLHLNRTNNVVYLFSGNSQLTNDVSLLLMVAGSTFCFVICIALLVFNIYVRYTKGNLAESYLETVNT